MKKTTEKTIRREAAYYAGCAGIVIDMMAIPRVRPYSTLVGQPASLVLPDRLDEGTHCVAEVIPASARVVRGASRTLLLRGRNPAERKG